MLISDSLIYVELQKGGSSSCTGLLKRVVGSVKDEPAPDVDVFTLGKPVLGAVRDPWSWYLSQWIDGCNGKGDLFKRLTDPKKWKKALEKAAASATEGAGESKAAEDVEDVEDEDGKDGKKKAPKLGKNEIPPHCTPERAKDYWYASAENVEAFHEWLKTVLGVPALRNVIEAGYGKSPVARVGGLLTYRYITQYTAGGTELDKTVKSVEALAAHDAAHCRIQHFVRLESFGKDALKALDALGVELTDHKRQLLEGPRGAIADFPKPLEHYYDKDTSGLVLRREKFLVDKFSYKSHRP